MLWWISGGSRSGKTKALVEHFAEWVQAQQIPEQPQVPAYYSCERSLLLLTDSREGRQHLSRQIEQRLGAGYFPYITTPLGFMQDEVILFWPLLVQCQAVAARSPLRLATEVELEWAKQLWQPELEQNTFAPLSENRDRAVRHLLDIFQLAAFARLDLRDVPTVIQDHFVDIPSTTVTAMVTVLERWRTWCTQESLLTYGIITDLFGRLLLPHSQYQQSLRQRFRGILADNVHNYPALFADFLGQLAMPADFSLPPQIPSQALTIVMAHQPTGAVRLGLGADPDAFLGLQAQASVSLLPPPTQTILGKGDAATLINELLTTPQPQLPPTLRALQTTSRMQLLHQIVATITEAVQKQHIAPAEIAILGPGIDSIARYVLTTELAQRGIPLVELSEQRPLIQSPQVRALLTLLILVYPGTGLECPAGAIAELLEVFHPGDHGIDAVRAGLLAAHCFQPQHPQLLPVKHYGRWDRFGYRVTTAYEAFRTWLGTLSASESPMGVLDQAIQRYLWPQNLSATELAPLRSLLNSAADYWCMSEHLQARYPTSPAQRLGQWIRLLHRGTVTADPPPFGQQPEGVVLGTTFQYRSAQLAHRWHFWLDASSPRWQDGGLQALWQAPIFLRQGAASPSARVWQSESERLQQLLVDLCCRVGDRLYLCHSDLAVNGREQDGPLLGLVDLAAGSIDGTMIDTVNA